MKKFISAVSCCFAFLLLFAFSGCSSVVKDPEVWESPDNPTIMVVDGVIPKPDAISIYKDGNGKQLEPGTEEFDNFWQAVSDLINGNGKFEQGDYWVDAAYNFEYLEEKKDRETCFEFLYDKIYVQKDTTRRFKGLFFQFDTYNLVYGYYTVNENGDWSGTEDGNISFNAFLAVPKTKYQRKINRILDLIVLD